MTDNSNIQISIIIPTYNYANFIKDAIESVLQQDYPKDKIEIIVVDDGSTDNTKPVLQSLINAGTVKYFYQENEGKASATRKAIQQSGGKYIFNLDADDYFLEGKLRETVEIFQKDAGIVHVGSQAKQLMPDGSSRIEPVPVGLLNKTFDGNELLKRFMNNNMLFGGGSTYAARAEALKQIDVPTAVDMFTDEFLILAILPMGKSYLIGEPLSVWRGHGKNYSLDAVTKDEGIAKSKRMLDSSDALLYYLETNGFDKRLTAIYQLKNLVNHISFKEMTGTKTLKDIVVFSKTVFFRIKPGMHLVKQYHVLNRLVPTRLFRLGKKIFKRNSATALQSV
ncbi:MAG: glycosyltransferase [Bacteroidetes bacterium]|nr:glycosyltransferase [Bacteroidota bacterium]